MSQVYTASDVFSGKLPTVRDISFVMKLLRKFLSAMHLVHPEWFPAATFFGSCARGDFNVCSDVGVALLINDYAHNKDEVKSYLRNFEPLSSTKIYAEQIRVKISMFPIFLSKLKSGETSIDQQFLYSLVHHAMNPSVIICGQWESFGDFYKVAPIHTVDMLCAYTSQAITKIQKRAIMIESLSELQVATLYRHVYQGPFEVARKAIYLSGETDYLDSRAGVVEKYQQRVNEQHWRPLEELRLTWESYVQHITSRSEGNNSPHSPLVLSDVEKSVTLLDEISIFACCL